MVPAEASWQERSVAPSRFLLRAACIALLAGAGCEDRPTAPPAAPPATAANSGSVAASAASARVTTSAPSAPSPPAPASEREEAPDRSDGGSASTAPWIADDVVDVGPAGPSSATRLGVAMVSDGDELEIAALGPKPARASPRAGPSALGAVKLAAASFTQGKPGPALAGGHVYWISKGRLVRRSAEHPDAALEVLASDAYDGTRVAAPVGVDVAGSAALPEAVAYIARPASPDDGSNAQLWIEGKKPLALTPAGAAASAVAVARSGGGLLVVALEARTSMAPLHARTLLDTGAGPKLGDDVVVWVGGPADSLTMLSAVGSGVEAWALLALERDATRFGLARIDLGGELHADSPVAWRDYPNGLSPAPIASAVVCGGAAVLYASPEAAAPGALQELRLARIEHAALGTSDVIGRARTFAQVSLAATDDGRAIAAWVGDHRSWARVLRCRQ